LNDVRAAPATPVGLSEPKVHLHELKIVNRFHSLGPQFYREQPPQGLPEPELIRADHEVAALLGLAATELNCETFLQVFSGNRVLPGSRPLAQDYAGHQFGRFNPFLGDGRSLLLGGVDSAAGHWEITLKGAGRTPYARDLDGRASLSECLHEFDCSQRLAQLGIPTARAVCVIAGNMQVYRRGFERAAVLGRLAPSHVRFGTFENYYFQRDFEALQRLADHLIEDHFAECDGLGVGRYARFLRVVVRRSARLVAHWQAAGFTHGMMNTDNQSILGITLDLDASTFTPERDSEFVASSVDEHGRYAFGRQPLVGLWNCNVLARALSPLIPDAHLRSALRAYEPEYLRHYEKLTASGRSGA
jgi:uncharacterized protein YdiU (UPF0061 family)